MNRETIFNALLTIKESIAYFEVPLTSRLRNAINALEAELANLTPNIEDASQDWAKLDGAVAWHLIERHAENWGDVGKMMDEYVAAKLAKPEQEPVAYWNGKDMVILKNETDSIPNWSDYYPEPLYSSPFVFVDNSSKTVKQLHPDWDMVAPLVERVNELERELHEYKKQKNLDTLKECVQKSDESIYEMQKLGQELDKLLKAKNHG
jgi:hypothetical protein